VFDSGGAIFKINIDGTGLLNLTSTLGESFEADWSPTGDSIVFKQEVGDDGLIYTMDSDGTNVFQVTPPDGMLSGNPDWSPDGARIVFDTSDRNFNVGDVIVIDADGGNRTNLTDDTEEDSGNPSWSPDGQHIVYEIQAPLAFASGAVPAGIPPLQLFVMNTDGSSKHNLTQDALLYEFDADWGLGPATPTPSASPTPVPTDTPPAGENRLWGDNDCNGSISSRDNQALLRNVLSQTALSQTEPCPDIGSSVGITVPAGGQQLIWGDLDCNGSIGARDNQALLRNVLAQAALGQTEPCPDIGTAVLVTLPGG
jgi:Tol biopolymer transport system component